MFFFFFKGVDETYYNQSQIVALIVNETLKNDYYFYLEH